MRWSLFAVGLALALSVSACGGARDNVDVDASKAPPWARAFIEGARAAWQAHGVDVVVHDVADDSALAVEVDDANTELGDFGVEVPSLRGVLRFNTRLEDAGAPGVCVAMHEIGHALGMSHVSDPRSLMAPVAAVAPDGGCFWSEDDQRAFDER